MQSRTTSAMIPVAVFDVSSASVAGAHGLVAKGAKVSAPAVILAQAREEVSTERTEVAQYIEEVVKHFESVIDTVSRADVHHPESILLVLASPWYVSQTRTITYKKTTPFICTQKLVNELIGKEIDYILTHTEDPLGGLGNEYEIVEKQLSRILLNGYPTNAPYGKKTSAIDISLTVTVVPKLALERFKSAITRVYGPRRITVTTSPYATYIVARDHFDVTTECTIIDVGELVTDVAFVKDDLFLYEHSFPIGTSALYTALGDAGGHTVAEAKALLETYRFNKTGTQNAVVESALAAFKSNWQKGLQQILDAGQFGFCLPEQCFITADPQFGIFFSDTIANDPFIQHSCSRGIVRATAINESLVGNAVSAIEAAPFDIALAVGLVFFTTILKHA